MYTKNNSEWRWFASLGYVVSTILIILLLLKKKKKKKMFMYTYGINSKLIKSDS